MCLLVENLGIWVVQVVEIEMVVGLVGWCLLMGRKVVEGGDCSRQQGYFSQEEPPIAEDEEEKKVIERKL